MAKVTRGVMRKKYVESLRRSVVNQCAEGALEYPDYAHEFMFYHYSAMTEKSWRKLLRIADDAFSLGMDLWMSSWR